MKKPGATCWPVLALAVAVSAARAETIELPAAADNTLYESPNGDTSNGSGPHFLAGRLGSRGDGSLRRALLRFDLAGSIPAGSSITAVRLQLRLSNQALSGTTMTLHRLTASWGEGASIDSSGNGRGSVPASPGDATWFFRFFDSQRWTRDGGDFRDVPSATVTAGGLGPQMWGSTEAMVADAQLWLDQPERDFGWILIGDEELLRSVQRFDSRENAVAANRPRLIVDYEPPALPTATFTLVPPSPTATRPTPTRRPPPTPGPCFGDCNGDGAVRVAELIRGVSIALRTLPLESCPAFDNSGNGSVEIGEIIAAVNAALFGCIAAS